MLSVASERIPGRTPGCKSHVNLCPTAEGCTVFLNKSRNSGEDWAAFSETRSQVALEQQELLDLLDSPAADEARIDELIDILGNSKQPFTEASIGGGPWQVVYTKGPLLWQQLTSPGAGGKRVRQGGSQEFIPEGRRLVNFGSLLGGLASVSANGTYELQEDGEASPNLPKTIMAKVAGGSAKIGDLQIPLPIKGTGTVDLLYIDNSIRIFQNSQGSRVVQRKASM
ncbi:hypothetical protein WJX74_003034 [Apatococcus lobatus]|uniref:Plastid lipid-associated protein/fibrillin conserved domain-containing protein n=1 Tax=Apatococcus lobatus TaxID=904363 RepID=A0AAW1RBY7_9CHLO